MESPVRNVPLLTVQDPLAAAGAVVLDCRPRLLPVSMDISGVDLSAIWASALSAESGAFPPKREQSFGGLIVTPAGYNTPAIPDASVVITQPLVVTFPAGPTVMDPAIPRPSTGSVGCSSMLPSLPVVSTPEGSPSSRAAPMDQCRLCSGSSFGGESAGRPLPPASLTPRPTGASPHVGESGVDGGALGCARLVSRGPF